MRRVTIATVAGLFLTGALSLDAAYAQGSSPQTVTLYSILRHRGETRTFGLNFQTGPGLSQHGDYDLRYGNLYAGSEFDWFQSSTARGSRTVIKDLGKHAWTDAFKVPYVEPFAKLKPGEQRQISVNTSGADGADGAPGAAGSDGYDGNDRDRSIPKPRLDSEGSIPRPSQPSRAKYDGKVRVSPVFVKAIVGHMYVIHVVTEVFDFYALFRVDLLESGDNCTISWKPIARPENDGPIGL